MSSEANYRNTDLEIVSADDLEPLAAAFRMGRSHPHDVYAGEDGRYYLTVNADFQVRDPGKALEALLGVIDALPAPLQAEWQRCMQRRFNIGYDCDRAVVVVEQDLDGGLLARIASVGASLRVTLYLAAAHES